MSLTRRTEGRLDHSRERNVAALQDRMALPSHDQLVRQQELCGALADGPRTDHRAAI